MDFEKPIENPQSFLLYEHNGELYRLCDFLPQERLWRCFKMRWMSGKGRASGYYHADDATYFFTPSGELVRVEE